MLWKKEENQTQSNLLCNWTALYTYNNVGVSKTNMFTAEPGSQVGIKLM